MRVLRVKVVFAFASAVLALATVAASANGQGRPLAGPQPPKGAVPAPPVTLPGLTKGVHALGGRWIVGARPGAGAAVIARELGVATLAAPIGLYIAPEARAARFVARLRAAGLFSYAEPDVPVSGRAFPADPLTPQQWWVNALIAPELVPPPAVTTLSLGVVDSGVDLTHPEFTDGRVTVLGPGSTDLDHGTAVASIASAPANGLGIVGLWPGAPVRFYEDQGNCSGAAAAVTQAGLDRVQVINMSYGVACFSHVLATEFAFGLGSTLVASAGNSYPNPNTLPRPAADPHVLTVGAVAPDLSVAPFSSATGSLDLAAPGVGIPAAIPVAIDTADGVQDGFRVVDGTSASAPLVSAAAAWLRTVRPGLSAGQAADLVRFTTRDIATPGWDDRTGYGLLDLAAALRAPDPPDDPNEPNDDIEWVDGTHFRKDRAALRHRSGLSFFATLDFFEDPIDVVPVYLPHGVRLRVDVVPSPGRNVDVEVFSRTAHTVFFARPPRTLKAHGYRRGSGRETVVVTNLGPTTVVYVNTFVPGTAAFADAGYRLVLRRTKLPAGARCGPVTARRGCIGS